MDLAKSIQEHHGLPAEEAQAFIRRAIEVINDGLQTDRQVKLKGLGTFKVTTISSRKSVDVNTGEPIIIDGRDKISFAPENSMRDLVNRPFAQFETVVLNDEVDFTEIDNAMAAEETADGPEISEEKPVAQPVGTVIQPLVELAETEGVSAESKETVIQESQASAATQAFGVEDEPLAASVSMPLVEAESIETIAEPLQLKAEELAFLNMPGTESALDQETPAFSESTTNAPAEPPVVEQAQEIVILEQTAVSSGEHEVETEEIAAIAGKASSEGLSGLTTTEQEPQNADEAAMDNDENEEKDAEEQAHLLEQKVSKNKRTIMLLSAACALLFLLSAGGFLYMRHQLQLRDHRLDHMLAMMQSKEIVQPVAKQAQQQAFPASTAPAADNKPMEQEQKTAPKEPTTEKTTVSAAVPALPAQSAPKTKIETAKKQNERKQPSAYDTDPRVRTGAYRITGIERMVKVRRGQTLKSISKANLGPGMECYIEAVNPGVTELKEGQSIKIPALELKKRK